MTPTRCLCLFVCKVEVMTYDIHLEMRSFVCVILMSVQFVVACAAIYNATQSFLYKIRLWKPISAVIIAVISLTMFLVSTHVLSKIYYDNQINKMAEFFGRMPFALSVGITAYCAIMSVYITVRLHHCRNTDITAMSIKESFDACRQDFAILTKTDLLY